jgi:hypothetical protein
MPDEPTTRAGDAGASEASFHGPVERVERVADEPPAVPPIPPRQPVARPPVAGSGAVPSHSTATPTGRVRARKVRRIVRHIEPWSVLKISLLFYAALFLIICVASALLWGAARSSGTVENVESFITSVGGFGNCEPIDGATPITTTTTLPGAAPTTPVDQIDPGGTDVPVTEPTGAVPDPGNDEDCREGEELVGEFKFEDARIFQAFALGGIVLVLAGSAAMVVLVLLFNLMSDLTGGVRVTVLEEDSTPRSTSSSGSPAKRPRD